MGSQRSIFLTKTDQFSMGTLWVAKCQIFLIKTDQSSMGTLWVVKGQIFLTKTDQLPIECPLKNDHFLLEILDFWLPIECLLKPKVNISNKK